MSSTTFELEHIRRVTAGMRIHDPNPPMPHYPDHERAEANMHARDGLYTAAELMRMQFPDVRWVLPGIIPEGLTLLGGAPKIGKSWLFLETGLAVAGGRLALGAIPTETCGVLYLALEDNQRRMQKRMGALLDGAAAPDELKIKHAWPKLDAGGIEAIEHHLDLYPDTGLVMIDTYAKIRSASTSRRLYDDDYSALAPLHDVANNRQVAIVLAHHLNQGHHEDWTERFSGTAGLTGVVDTLLGIFRDRARADAVLKGTGRDVDDIDLALEFDAGQWRLLGDADDYRKSEARIRVLSVLADSETPMTPKEVHDALDGQAKAGAIRKLMAAMGREGALVNDNGSYSLPPPQPGNRGNSVTQLSYPVTTVTDNEGHKE